MLDAILWVLNNFVMAFYNFGYAVTHPGLWLDWSDKKAIMRFVYYGGSVEFFFVCFAAFIILTIIGIRKRAVLWRTVRILEGLGNGLGRFFAWAGLIMVIQQVVIVFLQRIFAVSEIPLIYGIDFLTKDVSWYGEELKLYNALIVTMCVTYTFIQGGHVRVDLVYARVSFRAKKIIDMVGSMIFMMPMAVLMWMYGWYFMWRHLIVPNPSASDTLEKLLNKSRALRWNIETIGFSPNGFNAYFLFKVIMVTMAGLIFLQSIAFFYRSYLELKEGEPSEGKYLDKDTLGEGQEAFEGTH